MKVLSRWKGCEAKTLAYKPLTARMKIKSVGSYVGVLRKKNTKSTVKYKEDQLKHNKIMNMVSSSLELFFQVSVKQSKKVRVECGGKGFCIMVNNFSHPLIKILSCISWNQRTYFFYDKEVTLGCS